jgi:DNA-binding XRE family transcriptional regulator
MSEMRKLPLSVEQQHETRREYLDPAQQIERLQIEGRDYVLMRDEVYRQILHEIESLDSALELERAQTDANRSLTKSLLRGNYSAEQIRRIVDARTPAERFALMREFRNLNQSELAAEAGVSQTTISNIENGRVQFRGVNSARRVFSALGASDADMFELLAERDEKTEENR